MPPSGKNSSCARISVPMPNISPDATSNDRRRRPAISSAKAAIATAVEAVSDSGAPA